MSSIDRPKDDSPDRQNRWDRRAFLKSMGALGVAATGLGALGTSEKAKAVSVEEGVLGYFLFGGFDKTKDKKERDGKIHEIKNQNTTAQIEKTLASSLSDEELGTINSEPDRAAEVVRNSRISHFNEKGIEAGGVLLAGIAAGTAIGKISSNRAEEGSAERDLNTFYGGVGGAIVGVMAAAAILGTEPTRENSNAAETNLVNWIKEEMRLVGSISKETIAERVQDLTTLQETNSEKIRLTEQQ